MSVPRTMRAGRSAGYGGAVTSLRTPRALWMGLAGALGAGGVLEGAVGGHVEAAVAVPVAVLMAASVALAWWHPLPAIGVQVAVVGGQAPLDNPLFDMGFPLYALGAAVGMLAARENGPRLAVGIVLSLVAIGLVLVPEEPAWIANTLFAVGFLLLLPALVGRAFRSRARLNAELRERARGLAEDQRARSEEAAAAERRRIAGELHDLVAHGVSGMVVQAGAARRLVRAGDPRAAEAILAVEEGGRASLTELRRLLGVLRRDDADLALAPQPSLGRIHALIAHARAGGRSVELRIQGEAPELTPGLDVAGYRLVEEALRAAAGPARVTVEYGSQAVELCVEGTAPSPEALVGLRERVSMFGGELSASRGGTPSLRARLPLRGAA